MASARHDPKYLLEEPTTGCYIVVRPGGESRIAERAEASTFPSARAALIAGAAHLAGEAHELVRVTA